jgi:signal transduction histidine kinase
MHGGTIAARNEAGGGLTVEINLHSARSLHDYIGLTALYVAAH